MFISRLSTGMINCSAAAKEAHAINLSDARYHAYIRQFF